MDNNIDDRSLETGVTGRANEHGDPEYKYPLGEIAEKARPLDIWPRKAREAIARIGTEDGLVEVVCYAAERLKSKRTTTE